MASTPEFTGAESAAAPRAAGRARATMGNVREGLVVATAAVLRASDFVVATTAGTRRGLGRFFADARVRARQMSERAAERAKDTAERTKETSGSESGRPESK